MSAAHTSDLAAALAEPLLERFARYVRVDTEARPDRERCPSSPGQLELGAMLVEELRAIGLQDAEQDANGYVFATLGSTTGEREPVVGLLAHLDTSPDVTGHGVEPMVHRGYDGGAIELPRGGTRLDPSDMAELADCVGHDIVTASGDTLLGADDKAGLAIVMSAVAHLAAHPELPRPTIRVGFTPDEEIGLGAALFDVERFGARCAYTLDGSLPGELQDETFTAAEARIVVYGVEIHPGTAAGRLVNALKVVSAIVAALPADRLSPETTADREGFVHPHRIEGTAGRAELRVILRDFEDDRLAEHEALLRRVAGEVLAQAPGATIEIDVRPQYPNMRTHLEPFPEIVGHAERAIREEGLEPLRTPIRGGTDGSQLSAMGLPTPNLFTGGREYHSVREWASLQDMASAAAVVVRLAGHWAGGPAQ